MPDQAKRAEANPVIRANVLLPAARFGIREEMKQSYGFGWRDYVRGVTTTFDIGDNLAFREKIDAELTALDAKWSSRIDPAFTLDPAKVSADKTLPNVIVVAADGNGDIVRYYEAGETAAYFGSLPARSADNGLYDPSAESRRSPRPARCSLAIAIANQGRDTTDTPLRRSAGAGCRARHLCERRQPAGAERAIVAFACSLNAPADQSRSACSGKRAVKRLIDGFGFTMPPAAQSGGTPPSTAVVLGQIAGAPRRVHFMSSVILASLIGRGTKPVKPPTLITAYDYTQKGKDGGGLVAEAPAGDHPEVADPPGRRAADRKPARSTALLSGWRHLVRHAEEPQPMVRAPARRLAAALRQDRHIGDARSQRHRRRVDHPAACSSPMARPIPMSCLSAPARHQRALGPRSARRTDCGAVARCFARDLAGACEVESASRSLCRLHRQQRVFPQRPHFLHCMAKRWRARARAHANDHRRTSNSAPSARTDVPSSPQGPAFAAGCAKRSRERKRSAGTKSAHCRTSLSRSCDMKNADCRAILVRFGTQRVGGNEL